MTTPREQAPREQAQAAQRQASDPDVSAFVAASAGSGKTKLLTDRLLRLMLAGTRPEKIQCLTFTKAAAAEMALRLQNTLAEWVRLDDAKLDEALRDRGITPSETVRAEARRLFARVLDLPGGMRIGTIHAFCQSVLRRFPLEAAISPHFRLEEERDSEERLTEATEATLARARGTARSAPVEQLAAVLALGRFTQIVKAMQARRTKLEPSLRLPPPTLAETIRRALNVSANTEDELIATHVHWQAERDIHAAAHAIANEGSPSVQMRAGEMLDWLALDAETRQKIWPDWRELFLRDPNTPRGMGALINKKLAETCPDLPPILEAEQTRLLEIEASRRDLRAAEASIALAELARPLLDHYEQGKSRAGVMDYDDLIGRTAQLLIHPGAAWVLYKLDGGIDHLLLDEVQDTAPAQWEIAGALTQEFFAGSGARDDARTIFAVGDRKQSIYSFQGADPDAFDHWRGILRQRVQGADSGWRDVALDVSFRSTTPVLELVDAVFADPQARQGVLEQGTTLHHRADRAAHAGRVELWPLATAEAAENPEPWATTRQNHTQQSARQRLAETLADWIRDRLAAGEMLESKGRKLTAGDILILVRRRDALTTALVRALKARGVSVGGLDRIVLTEQPAVQDLIALGDALLLPEDDLAFANFLVSPLGGLTHDDLEALAVGRAGTLAQALRARTGENPHWSAAWDRFAALQARADFVSPFALYSEALGAQAGRARFLARLGAEAEEPINEFLNATLSYTRLHPPSLQGFLQWLRRSGAEVKREQEEAGGAVRVMTVHGAKGLQAPLVILPDTTGLPPENDSLYFAGPDGSVPVFIPNIDHRGTEGARLRAAVIQRQTEEYNRQLYVALTRAEDRLIVCGWQGKQAPQDHCWYRLIERGFSRLNPTRAPFAPGVGHWEGEILAHASPQTAEPQRAKPAETIAHAPLPAWAGTAPDWRPAAPPAEPPLPQPLAPSRPEGAELGKIPGAASPLAERDVSGNRFQRGKLVHALLQHLPTLPAPQRAEAARAWLARPGTGLDAKAALQVAAEVLAILNHPELAELFGPDSLAEVPLTGVIAGHVIGGLVDRIAVSPSRILLADYKTNRDPPSRAEDTPILYLRQLAAYRAVLEGVFPGREILCALVWTRTAQPVILPPELLAQHTPHVWPAPA